MSRSYLGARTIWNRPPVGRLFGYDSAVWRIVDITDLELDNNDREAWLREGMPDLATWPARPYRAAVEWVGGKRPDNAPADDPHPMADRVVRVKHRALQWDLYPESGRWPMCSCCGEPMPCRAELQDREVTAGFERMTKWVMRQSGCCWGCGEPITRRQKSIAYPGENLDLPGGMEVRFHTRTACWSAAVAYEERWVAVDPRHERVLTWPECGGTLIVHFDGTSECTGLPGPITGLTRKPRAYDCRGHSTHNHSATQACYVGVAWLAPESEMPGCPRGCPKDGHPGAAPRDRLPRAPWGQEALA